MLSPIDLAGLGKVTTHFVYELFLETKTILTFQELERRGKAMLSACHGYSSRIVCETLQEIHDMGHPLSRRLFFLWHRVANDYQNFSVTLIDHCDGEHVVNDLLVNMAIDHVNLHNNPSLLIGSVLMQAVTAIVWAKQEVGLEPMWTCAWGTFERLRRHHLTGLRDACLRELCGVDGHWRSGGQIPEDYYAL